MRVVAINNNDSVAQLVELPAFNRKVVGSSPTGITKYKILSLSGYSNWLLTSRDNVLSRGFESHQDHKIWIGRIVAIATDS